MRFRARAAAAVAIAAALLLSGCANDSLAEGYREGSNKGYIAGDGTVATFDVGARQDPVEFEGATIDGSTFNAADARGEVLVVNFWYAQCPPCRAEARDLESISASSGDDVQFVGVNVRDEAGTAKSFEDEFGVTYPSIIDAKSGAVQQAFSANIPPNAVPTTLVLDKQGRVAARILGRVLEPSILTTLIRDTAAETE